MVTNLETQVFGSVWVDYPTKEGKPTGVEPYYSIYLGPSEKHINELIDFIRQQEPEGNYGAVQIFHLSADNALLELGKLLERSKQQDQSIKEYLYHEIMSGLRAYNHHVYGRCAVYLCSTRDDTFLGQSLDRGVKK